MEIFQANLMKKKYGSADAAMIKKNSHEVADFLFEDYEKSRQQLGCKGRGRKKRLFWVKKD